MRVLEGHYTRCSHTLQDYPTRRSRSRQASAGTGGAMSGWHGSDGIRAPNQSAMRWFTRFAGWAWESGLFRIWPRRMVPSHASAASVRKILARF